jgi:integrase
MRLIKPQGKETWHVEIETESGERKLLDTECKTKAEAQQVCNDAKVKEIETASRSHRLTAEVVALITSNRQIKVPEAIDEWEEWMKTVATSEKTRVNYTQMMRQWVKEMELSDRSLASLTTADINKWVNPRNSPLKYSYRKVRLYAIRSFYEYCTVRRYVLGDPSKLAEVDPKIMNHEQRRIDHKKVFTDEEIEFLLAKADGAEPESLTPGFFKAAIILGRDLGIRLVDVCNLEWVQFDFAHKLVRLLQFKTGGWVEIPLTKRAAQLVTKWEKGDKRYLFPHERRIINDKKDRALISVCFGRFFKRCGFDGYSYHSLRATMATTMANRGATMAEIAEALGHTKGSGATSAYVRKPNAANVNIR